MKLNFKAHTCEWMRRVSLFLTVLMMMFFWASFADFGGAKNSLRWKDVSGGGYALWIFIILGAIIILLQLIPAVILLFSVIGTGTHIGYKVVDDKVSVEKVEETVKEER